MQCSFYNRHRVLPSARTRGFGRSQANGGNIIASDYGNWLWMGCKENWLAPFRQQQYGKLCSMPICTVTRRQLWFRKMVSVGSASKHQRKQGHIYFPRFDCWIVLLIVELTWSNMLLEKSPLYWSTWYSSIHLLALQFCLNCCSIFSVDGLEYRWMNVYKWTCKNLSLSVHAFHGGGNA